MKNILTRESAERIATDDQQPVCDVAPSPDDGNGDDRFLETVYKDGAFAKRTLSLTQVLAIAGGEVDCEINEVTGEILIQRRAGHALRHDGGIPGLGPDVGQPLLEELMWQAGQLLTVYALTRNPKLMALTSSAVRASWLRRLRAAFGETVSAPWYFQLYRSPWRLRWSPNRSWRIVERLAVGA